jgi:hypothetical protein
MHFTETFQRGSFIPAPGQPLVFGRFLIPTEEPFLGQIAEIRLWDDAKASDTSQYADEALTGTEPGLLACWTFEEGAGPIARDISPNANHARLGDSVGVDATDPVWLDIGGAGADSRRISGHVLGPNGVPVMLAYRRERNGDTANETRARVSIRPGDSGVVPHARRRHAIPHES